VLHHRLLVLANDSGWLFKAQAVFPNYYQLNVQSLTQNTDAGSLKTMLRLVTIERGGNRSGQACLESGGHIAQG
jgi:hypothetical protein